MPATARAEFVYGTDRLQAKVINVHSNTPTLSKTEKRKRTIPSTGDVSCLLKVYSMVTAKTIFLPEVNSSVGEMGR